VPACDSDQSPTGRWLSSNARLNWAAAALLGLVTSTFSTIVSQLLAARIGRDAAVDWMIVAAIPLRDGALQAEPNWGVILVGILFHQWADFSWAVIFFGLLGCWTGRLRPGALLLIGLPWALFTSGVEWFFLVPVLPFWQPVFTLQQPYWIGLLVHMASASLYPLFPWLRDRLARRVPSPHRGFARIWGGLAVAGTTVLSVIAILGWQGHELPHTGGETAFDQSYMRRMAAHHVQGAELALLAADRAQDLYVRRLARLMAASQNGEIAIFDQWWRSWFNSALPPATVEEHDRMPGMLSTEEMETLRHSDPGSFDGRFVAAMSFHHRGAIVMSDEALGAAAEIRLRLMAHAIRHEQRGDIALLQGSVGLAAVRSAVLNMLRPAGAAPVDGPAISLHQH
jgi:uncharacterized protein (DUF305 family)